MIFFVRIWGYCNKERNIKTSIVVFEKLLVASGLPTPTVSAALENEDVIRQEQFNDKISLAVSNYIEKMTHCYV